MWPGNHTGRGKFMAAGTMGRGQIWAGLKAVLWAAMLASILTTALTVPAATPAHAESDFCTAC